MIFATIVMLTSDAKMDPSSPSLVARFGTVAVVTRPTPGALLAAVLVAAVRAGGSKALDSPRKP